MKKAWCDMKNKWIRILVWLAVMSVLTLIALGIWMIAAGGSQTTASLKWLQLLQTLGTFLLPPLVCAALWDENHRPLRWLGMSEPPSWRHWLPAVGIMLCALPAINLLADLNSRVSLPESLGFIEQILKRQEEAAALLTERFLQADNVAGLLINLGLMALLPALAEEMSFRGTLQQIIEGCTDDKAARAKMHTAIWVTAFVFSAIHMQFYGFVPRMLMGAMFGYVFVWTGSLWVPVLMHFTNNALAVLVYYFSVETGENTIKYADTIGAGNTWWLGVISLLVTSLDLLIFYRRTRKQ